MWSVLPKSRLGWVVIAVAAALVGCWKTKPNPEYCNATTACAESLHAVCVENRCVPTTSGGDGGDMSVGDAAVAPTCTSNSECTAANEPICDVSSGACRACATGDCMVSGKTACATAGPNAGACVECAGNSDCAAAGKTCDTTTNTCVACTANGQCTSLACNADGTCAQSVDVVFVDNKGGTCTGTHAGTSGDPYCLLSDGLSASASTIAVVGSMTPYVASIISAVSKNIDGPGIDASTPVTLSTAASDGLVVNPSSGAVTLALAGVIIIGAGGATPGPGVSCNASGGATAKLTLVRSSITGSGADALDATSCDIVLDASQVTLNRGGVKLTGGTFTVTNNIIAGNGNNISATTPGFQVDATAVATGLGFSFNTVVDNETKANISGGIDCGNSGLTIVDSIVTNNTTVGTGSTVTQFANNCAYDTVVVGSAEGTLVTGQSATVPSLTSSFELDTRTDMGLALNNACCIDRIDASMNDHDVVETPRPQRKAWDVGAFEAPAAQ